MDYRRELDLISSYGCKKPSQLKPSLNTKVDELFLRWVGSPSHDNFLKTLERIKVGRFTKYPTPNPSEVPSIKSILEKEVDVQQLSLLKEAKPLVSPRRRVIAKSKSKGEKTNILDDARAKSAKGKQSNRTQSLNIAPKVEIPQFYFPNGKPKMSDVRNFDSLISNAFVRSGKKTLELSQLAPVCKACGCPIYWKSLIFHKALKKGFDVVNASDVISAWTNVTSTNHDKTSRFVALLAKQGKKCLEFEDFLPLLRDIVDSHPGLTFLREAPEFHTRYMNTVIARIFYNVNRSWTGKITANELRRSNFLSTLDLLENEPDINMIMDYFSYEHFYVIYCKFWELDTDHDLIIDRNDLARHSDGVLSSRLVDRVLSGAVTRWSESGRRTGCMSYIDFIWFIISEEDKTTNTSIEYWFRCMDLDGDGYISLYEMEYFYEEQMRKLELLDIEALPFEDCACQMLDMINPSKQNCISLQDLKGCSMAGAFFDTFLNIEKYLEREQKDPFANVMLDEAGSDQDLAKRTDWERFAADEYEVLVSEEEANDNKVGLDMDDSLIDDFSQPMLNEELNKLGLDVADNAADEY